MTPATARRPSKRELLPIRHDFRRYCGNFWRILDKSGFEQAFVLNAAQDRIENAAQGRIDAGKPVRLRVLKYRQAGVSSYCTARVQQRTQTHQGHVGLSIADKQDLPAQWLRRCRGWWRQTPKKLRPHAGATNANELWFDKLQSRYYIGSAEGKTPGMGDCIRDVHCSEIAYWLNPDVVLRDLLPAIPPDAGTVIIEESTGQGVGDWWYQRYFAAKRGDEDYTAIFLPWFIQPEYTAHESEILSIAEDEKALVAAGVGKGQLAWRRQTIRTQFHGDCELFANQFPATEAEAFLAAGRNVFNAEQVARARGTVRPPVWRGDLVVARKPTEFQLGGSDGGHLLTWDHDPRRGELPERRFHYAIGADCQWGSKDTNDFDSAYVECCETNRVCARLFGRFDMGRWALMLAALGHYYSDAALAPERNGPAARGVILPLLGLAGNDWQYPNLWVRNKLTAYGVPKPEDYGWLTDEHTKPELVMFVKERLGSERGMDWADARAVDEMEAYIVDEGNKMTAPPGQNDDCFMGRAITGRVAADVWSMVALEKPAVDWGILTPQQRRIVEHLERKDEEERERERAEGGEGW